MAMMNLVSHGTQDMYPTFLQHDWGFSPTRRAALTAFSMVGALSGGVVCGLYSDRLGRRRTIVLALVGVRAVTAAPRRRRVRDAVLRPGGVGGDPGAHHRAVPRFGPRLSPRLRVPVRGRARELDPAPAGAARRGRELRLGDGALRRGRVRARCDCSGARARAARGGVRASGCVSRMIVIKGLKSPLGGGAS